jgi:hypothetical protein
MNSKFARKRPRSAMQWLLEDRDALLSVAACLTREEAAKLARLCKAGRTFVRAADADADAGRHVFVAGAPMWDLERTHARLAALYPQVTPRSCWRRQTMAVMDSLAAELVRQQEAGVVRLVFERAAACKSRQVSVFGCHRLEVADAHAFLTGMEAWYEVLAKNTASGALARWACAYNKASRRVLRMLQEGGLRVRGKKHRAPADARVAAEEALWHQTYWAW